MNDGINEMYIVMDGKEIPCPNNIIRYLIDKGKVLFIDVDYVDEYGPIPDTEETLGMFLNMNDVFDWGLAYMYRVTTKDLLPLWRAIEVSPKWGSVKFVAMKRLILPQESIIERMKVDGEWCELMQSIT